MSAPDGSSVRGTEAPPSPFRWEWNVFFLSALTCVAVLAFFPDEVCAFVTQSWAIFSSWARVHLIPVSEDSSWLVACLPTGAMVAFALILQLCWDRPPNWVRLPIAAVFLSLQIAYLVFRLSSTLSFSTATNAVVSVSFFLAELLVHVRIAVGNFSLLSITDRSAEADDSEQMVRSGSFVPSVDVFIPTYSEPVELLRRTIIGCQAMDYPKKTIWLLDDTRRPQMRMLAEELGCEYLDRPDNTHAKAGNLNHALRQTTGELVVCFDADFIPTRDFIARTAGFFRDADVAMVQTPQNFHNEDAVTRNLGLEHALEDEQKLFFRTLQPGRDAMNAIVCHGSCFVARRSAIEKIGGIPTETITEDWATSIKMQAAGYRLLYLNEALSAGLSADTCGEFIQQRARWAQGTLQALSASTHPLHVRGLTWKQRALHLASIAYYLGSVSNLLTLILPLFFLLGGVLIMEMTVAEMVFYRLPFTVGYYLLYSWLTFGNRSALWSEFYDVFLAPTMAMTVLRSIVNPFGVGFRVTNKAHRTARMSINWSVAKPFAVLILLHLVGIACAVATGRHNDQHDVFWIVLFFAAANMALLWMCLLVTIDVPHTVPFRRFERQLTFHLQWDNGQIAGETLLVSEGDVVVPAEPWSEDAPAKALLSIPSLGLSRIEVDVVLDESGETVQLVLPVLSLAQERTLITELYCQPGQWNLPPKNEFRAAWEYCRAGLRMYPLAEAA